MFWPPNSTRASYRPEGRVLNGAADAIFTPVRACELKSRPTVLYCEAETSKRLLIGVADLRAELLSFPAGRHDDQVDALGLVGQLLVKISAGPRPRPPDVTQLDGYRAAFEEMPDDSWKTM